MKNKLLLILPILLLSSCTNGNESSVELEDFENVTFSSASYVYDGQEHILEEVIGAPEGTDIAYTGRESHADVGEYRATALLTKEGYKDLTLTATLTITKASFENITFESASFEYDGEAHSIYVSGAPNFATVTYSNNSKRSVGSYIVSATISAPNYNTLTKNATLTIVGREITGVSFNDKEFEYDGYSHSIFVEGELPEGVTAKYTNNGKTESGTYKVTANLSGEGYSPLQLTANLIIKPVEIDKPGYFDDACFIYDGQNHSLIVEKAPYGTTVTYKCTNVSGTNTFKNPGQYDIEATVKINNNHMSVLKATMFIIEDATYGVDPEKEALTIDENLKWDELHEALNKDNYAYDYYSGSFDNDSLDDPIPSDLLDESCFAHDFRMHFVTDGKQAYSKAYSTYSDPYYKYHFYKEVGDDMFFAEFHDDGSNVDFDKIPKAAFSETVCKAEASNAFVALTKGDNGEFLNGVDEDDFYSDGGYPFIQDNKFIVLMIHYRTLNSGQYRYFYEIYEFYNIGNTTLILAETSNPSSDLMNKRRASDYRLGGVKYRYSSYGPYNYMVSYYSAELYVSYHTKVFLKPGTYTVSPFIYDEPVRAIVHYSYYNQYYNYDQSGYAFNLYINKDKSYQGEYAYLGSISRLDIRDFTNDDGVVNYYDDWH